MLPLLLASMLAAAPAPRVSLAAPGLTLSNLKANLADPLNEHLSLALTGQGIKTVTSSDIRAVLGLERQRQLLGCADDESASCLAELAGAMGVDGIVQGSITRLGKRVQVTVKIVSGVDGATLAAASESTTENELFDALTAVADRLGPALLAAVEARRPRPAPVVEAPPAATTAAPEVTAPAAAPASAGLARWWWLPAGLGVGLAVGSGLTFARALTLSSQLRGQSAEITDAPAAREEGQLMATLGWAFAGGAVAAGLASLGFVLFGQPAPQGPRVGAWLGSSGAGVTLSLEWR